MTSSFIVFDTSIFVAYLRTAQHKDRISSLSGLLRTSSVVLAELWRGASTRADREFLATLQKNHPVLVPSEQNWLESGQLLNTIRRDKGFAGDKLRDLHFDVLIALTARSIGARLITSNRDDFELIASYRPIHLEIW